MSSFVKSEFWKEFFRLYECLPETWKVSSEDYKNKHLKRKAYQKLLVKLKEIEPDATVETLKKKINSFRTSYRRELKKIKKSENSRRSSEGIYAPCLWYFDNLHFLEDQLEMFDCPSSDDSEPISVSNSSKMTLRPNKRRLRGKGKPRVRLEPPPKTAAKNDVDEADTLCASWVMRYRKLDPQQQLYANKTIEEVLYQAALGNLHEYSYKSVETYPMHRIYSSSNTESPPTTTSMFHNTTSPLTIDDRSQPFSSSYGNMKPITICGSTKSIRMQVHPSVSNRNTFSSDPYNSRHHNFDV